MKIKAAVMIAGLLTCVAATASAQDTYVETYPRAERPTRPIPESSIVAIGGAGLLVGTYIPSAIVAAASNFGPDENLWIPVVGPWINLGERANACHGDCTAEGVFKTLVIADGIAQGVGAIALVGGLIGTGVQMSRERTVYTAKPKVQFTPMQLGRGGMGAGVVGTW